MAGLAVLPGLGLALRLALADLRAEWLLAACTAVSLAAVLAPLVVLGGLRAGVVEGLREALLQDPRAREVASAANRAFAPALLARLSARPDVQFLVPRTRTLAATLLLEAPGRPGGVRVELVPTAPGDPLLGPVQHAGAPDALVLSAAAAARLHAAPGDRLTGRLARVLDGRRESVALPLAVQAVAPPAAHAREAAFVALPLAVGVEDFQDGRGGLSPHDAAPARDEYAGFRLYARQLEGVPALDAALRAEGIEVVSRAGDVAGLLRVDRNLGLLFALLAGLGGAGVLVSLGAGLWANVARKRVPLAQLRLLGLRAGVLRLVPAAQAAVLAAAGSALALAAAYATGGVVNRAFVGTLALDRPLCLIRPGLAATAAGAAVLGAVVVAAAAGTRAARVDPWEGVGTS